MERYVDRISVTEMKMFKWKWVENTKRYDNGMKKKKKIKDTLGRAPIED